MAFTNNDCSVDHISDWTVDKIRVEDKNLKELRRGLRILAQIIQVRRL